MSSRKKAWFNNVQDKLQGILKSTVASIGYELWGYEFRSQSGGPLLCVFVEKDTGVLVDDCSRINRQLRAVLEVETNLGDQLTLEVSSPGIERTLYCLSHYQRYLGHRVKVRLARARDNCRNFIGVIEDIDEEEKVVIATEQETLHIALPEIEKARLLVEF